ncbi:hypothetical protein C6A87_019925 [Mycobacterium sp. ITM-2016-00317]|uniref:hypothetical protein n=1 Tax=Mycobacterium sp. ITM-2016-00317 TaxID=2099694 RepID=UPI00287F64FD|nr:hypothetical protein [Mycobacterium sp. ITM-2016-00317]WNG86136.1 hypothetical protein C6A87_019925 [Mycobacterium sp. ITM-2016-00317]
MITDSVPEAILYAGGLMFDRRRAGWQVVVFTDDVSHLRGLAILGIGAQSRCRLDDREHGDREVRAVASPIERLATKRESPWETRIVWGWNAPAASTGVVQPVGHQLSAAARAFKEHALRCTGLRSAVEHCERFWVDDTFDTRLFVDLVARTDRPPRSAGRGGS